MQVHYYSPTDVFGEQDVNVDGTEVVLTELAKYQQYVVRVVAYNGNGPGPTTDELTCRTLSDGNRSRSLAKRCFEDPAFSSSVGATFNQWAQLSDFS